MKIDLKSFREKLTRDKEKKFPTGSTVFIGHQGKGKTLSMVHTTLKLKEEWPKSIIYSNIRLNPNVVKYNYFDTPEGLNKALNISNGEDGVILLIDEAHLFFYRKNGINFDTLMAISQQRKDRRKILFSTQIWEEMDISLRKQVKEIVSCNNIVGIQINTWRDGYRLSYNKQEGEYQAPKIYTEIFKHNDYLYSIYNTYQKIITNRDYYRPLALDNNLFKNQVSISVGKK